MNQEKIGNIIKNIRRKNNLTQREFAEKLGVTYQAVSKWENGKNIPDIAILKEISNLYKIDINYLLDNNINKNNKKRKYLITTTIFILLLIFYIIFNNNDFQFKTISSKCGEFKISGSIAYNMKKSSIYISNINYCGNKDNMKYKKIECILYEKHNNKEIKISSCDKDGKNINLSDYLNNISFNVNNYSLQCSKIGDDTLYLKITTTSMNNESNTFKVPLTINNNCTNNNIK